MTVTNNTPMLQALRDIATEAEEVWGSDLMLPALRQYQQTFSPGVVLRLLDLAERVEAQSALSSMVAEQRGMKNALEEVQAEAGEELDGAELATVIRLCQRVAAKHRMIVAAS